MEDEIYGKEAWQNILKDFHHLKGSVYLDHAGSTIYSQSQMSAAFDEMTNNCFGNPHSRHPSSRLTHDLIEQTRAEVLRFFNTDHETYSLIFTSGATASFKIVAENFNFGKSGSFVYLKESHTSVVGMRKKVLGAAQQIYVLPTEKAEEIFQGSINRISESEHLQQIDGETNNSLFVYPAQCNFSGQKYPLEWIAGSQKGVLNHLGPDFLLKTDEAIGNNEPSNWFCLVDAASYVSTSPLDLAIWQPDFVAVSFYKMIGYPTGLGALIVHRRAAETLKKKSYFGGGTVQMYSTSRDFHVDRPSLHDRFEDGTINFLSILNLRHGIQSLKRNVYSMQNVSIHTHRLAVYLRDSFAQLKHPNGKELVEIYYASGETFKDCRKQGGIISFNLKTASGDYVGYAQVEKVLALYDIHVRTGCFCNPAACQRYLRLTNEDIESHFAAGHVCGDEIDLVNGRPTGAIRVSFGYMSRKSDVDRLVDVIRDSFLIPTSSINIESPIGNVTGTPVLIGINVYPIKSCGPFKPKRWDVSRAGLVYDRQWVIVNASGAVLTQKRESRLCLINPIIDLQSRKLILSYRGCDRSVTLPLDGGEILTEDSTAALARVCGKTVQTVDCGIEVSDWLSEVLDQPGLRLLKYVDQQQTCSSSLANESPFLLVNRRSVQLLQSYIQSDDPAMSSTDEFMERFRPNLIIDGVDEFQEENWKSVSIGTFHFKATGLCYRCQMICVDQQTAERNQEPLRVLANTRGKKVPFGVHLELVSLILDNGSIQFGDEVSPKH